MNYNSINFSINEQNILFERYFSSWIHKTFFKNQGILCDIGSGTGNNSISFKNLGYSVIAVDFDDIHFRRLSEKGIKTINININHKKLPFKNNSLDFIFAKSIIEHLDDPMNFLREANRCLRPGGRIFILTPNWKKSYKIFYNDPTHKSPLSITSINKALLMNNFKIVHLRKFRNFPYIWRFFPIFSFNHSWFFAKEMIAIAEKSKY
jgi:ubiquinone/menaquinone biosynthesis C-methylase UbiE